jgi:preprotein translocase subunit YajC
MSPQQLSALLPLLVFVLFFFFFVWRPQATQMRRRREMLSSLRAGDRIVTVGGLHATITDIKEDLLTLELGPNMRVKADRAAVQTVRGRAAQAKALAQ